MTFCLNLAYALDFFFLLLLIYLYWFEYPKEYEMSNSVPSAILFCLSMVLLISVCIARYHIRRRDIMAAETQGRLGDRERQHLAEGGILIQLSQMTSSRMGPPLVLTVGPPREPKSSIDFSAPPPSYDSVMRNESAHTDSPPPVVTYDFIRNGSAYTDSTHVMCETIMRNESAHPDSPPVVTS